jgi:LytS/YehU family sensor histidine kinase
VDKAALEVPVPVLSVQPLVENAVKHGIAQSAGPGYVHVWIELRGEKLRILVENSSDKTTAEAAGPGVGLQNVRRRLEICYGPGATLRLAPDPQKTTAEICIPLAAR